MQEGRMRPLSPFMRQPQLVIAAPFIMREVSTKSESGSTRGETLGHQYAPQPYPAQCLQQATANAGGLLGLRQAHWREEGEMRPLYDRCVLQCFLPDR
ncbi:hypothetical protein WJX73_004050 [Symbiochloris irregularis]|uniref:Uncharacterized protein n=1 Tax=Symbiochloris irregularis TaxID=706552 RepID=A0AAW1NVL1_9CHLO